MALSKKSVYQWLNQHFARSVESKALSHLFSRVTDDLTNVTTSTYTVLDSDNLITLNRAAGIAVTLPAATGSGRKIKFVVGTSITSNTTTLTCAGSDKMQGFALAFQDDASALGGFGAVAGTSTVFTMDGSTRGGYAGDVVEITDVAAARWQVEFVGKQTGTEATPFSWDDPV